MRADKACSPGYKDSSHRCVLLLPSDELIWRAPDASKYRTDFSCVLNPSKIGENLPGNGWSFVPAATGTEKFPPVPVAKKPSPFLPTRWGESLGILAESTLSGTDKPSILGT